MNAPITIKENKRFRAQVLEKCEEDIEYRQYIIEKCRRDAKFFINTFCWTYDPRLSNPHLPFVLYPKQEALIEKLNDCLARSINGEQINLLLDKPRDVGATYTLMIWGLHRWLFHDFSFRAGSRKEDYVDKKGDPDTLFYKLDYNLDRLPEWMLPNFERASMILKRKDNSNVISGESANPNFGRGGRKSVILFDEHAFWEWSQSSWESAGEATNFRITMSSPPESGKDSFFFKLRAGQKGKVEVFEFDWKDVPSRDEKWFNAKREGKSDEEFAREVLKSYDGTTEGKVYAKDIQLCKLSNIEYQPLLPLFISWDFGLDGLALIWWQKDFKTNKLFIIDCYECADRPIDYILPFVTGEIESITGNPHHYEEFELEAIKRHKNWSREITHYGDPDVKKRAVKDGESTKDYLEKKGIYVQSKDWAGRKWLDLREKAKMAFRRIEMNEARTEILRSALRNAKYPSRRENTQSTTLPGKPVHDWTSHLRTSFEYFCDNEPEGIYVGASNQVPKFKATKY